jgi:hypothetical protein
MSEGNSYEIERRKGHDLTETEIARCIELLDEGDAWRV